jgi:hypothetical protein
MAEAIFHVWKGYGMTMLNQETAQVDAQLYDAMISLQL